MGIAHIVGGERADQEADGAAPRQLLDRQAFAGRQMTGDDRVVKRRERPVGQRAVAFDDPGCGEPPQSAGHLSSRCRTR